MTRVARLAGAIGLIATGVADAGAVSAEAPLRAPAPAPRAGAAPEPAATPAVAVAVRARETSFGLGEAPRLALGGAIAVEADHRLWGGLSGLAVAPDGERFWVVSDRAALFTGRFIRRDGKLMGIEDLAAVPLLDPRGREVAPGSIDAEGLALAPDGALLLSLEGDEPRIWRYARPGGRAAAVDGAPEFARIQRNSGLEALAVAPDGAILAIPERSGALDRPFPVFVRAPGADRWRVEALPRSADYLVTGADVGPDGALYVAERAFSWLSGFSARLRRVRLDGGALAAETLLERRGGTENVESVAAWRDAEGRLRLILATDDNFNALQRTVIAELILVDG